MRKEKNGEGRRKREERGEREGEREGEKEGQGIWPSPRRLLSVWPALPALRAPDGTLLKFIDNHKFRK